MTHIEPVFSLEVDLMLCVLTCLSFMSRLWMLHLPSAVVFDEVQVGKFASFYINGTFFFDTHPPLGKMLIAFGGLLGSYDGSFAFNHIGEEYPASAAVWCLRVVPAVAGGLLVPAVYQILLHLKYNRWICTLAALLILLDNAIVTQSRLMVVDSLLLLFLSLFTLCLIAYRNTENRNFYQSYMWMLALGITFSLSMCVKYTAVLMFTLAIYHVSIKYWKLLQDSKVSHTQCLQYLGGIVSFLIVVPLVIYSLVFYIHITLLYKSGPHDDMMTSLFQASLEGGLSDMTKDQPGIVAYGSQITLRQTHSTSGAPCWLHSHDHVYPVNYEDGRGSSYQQQVTCYAFKDVNNWWIIKDPYSNSIGVGQPIRPVRDGDIVQLVHGITGRALNSHDVAAPVSPLHQEVSCYIDYDINMDPQILWRVRILNGDSEENPVWTSIRSVVQLIHVNTSKALKTSGHQLGEWGFHQFEVVCDGVHQQPAAMWNVEEHQYSWDERSSNGTVHQDTINALGFWSKFYELQWKMLTSNLGQSIEHLYSSEAIQWPLMEQNIVYWLDKITYAQIHFVGNPLIWFPACLAVILYTLLCLIYLMRRKRFCFDIPSDLWSQYWDTTTTIFAGYIANYLPYFLMDRTLFVYQYLPSLFFSVLLLAAMIGHLHSLIALRFRRETAAALVVCPVALWMFYVAKAHLTLCQLSYGNTPIDALTATKLKWIDTWDFFIRKQ